MTNKSLLRLEHIRKKNEKNLDWKNQDLYKFFQKEEFYRYAYESSRMKFTFTYQDFSEDIRELVYIFEENKVGSKEFYEKIYCESIGITLLGRLLLEVVLIVLEAVYGFPFGTYRSTQHEALRKINQEFNTVKWVIVGECSSISKDLIFVSLAEKITDKQFLFLITKLLIFETPSLFIAQDVSLFLFPFLASFYLRKLDIFFNSQREFCFENYSRYFYPESTSRKVEISLTLGDLGYVVGGESASFKYIRYRNSWAVGILSEKIFTYGLKETLVDFLHRYLKIHSTLKIRVFNLYNEGFLFCGYFIGLSRKVYDSKISKRYFIRMELPIFYILNRFCLAGLCSLEGFPIVKNSWVNFSDVLILIKFNSILNTLCRYYSGIDNPKVLFQLQHLLKLCCARTIARKHQVSLGRVFENYGSDLSCFYAASTSEGSISRRFYLMLREPRQLQKVWHTHA